MISVLLLFIFCTEVKSISLLQNNKRNIRLTDKNKYNFMKNVMGWTQDTNDLKTESCFAINFGYHGFLPLPQVGFNYIYMSNIEFFAPN